MKMKLLFEDRNLIFLDPDNGIAPEGLGPRQQRAGKSVFISDVRGLYTNRQAIVVYHHQTRRKGGNEAELSYLAGRLREGGFRVCGALRAKPWSILDGDDELCTRAQEIERNWDGWIKWYSGATLGLTI